MTREASGALPGIYRMVMPTALPAAQRDARNPAS